MAKTGKNEKQGASEKRNLVKSSSNQKENRPRKVNVNRDHNDNIGMSKQLRTKKSTQKSRSKRKPTSAMRVMPSLADLEKMFEDSDEDINDINSAGPSCLNASNPIHNTAPTLNIPQEPSITSEVRANTEPITLNEPSHMLHDDVKLLSPPRKRVKLDTECDEIDDLPPIMISPSKNCTINSDSILTEDEQTENCQNNIKSGTIPTGDKGKIERVKPIHDNGNNIDSNKTIEHNLSTSASQTKTISESFSPQPSTSTDINTISENDKLFSRSMQLMNSNDTNATQTITQMVESFTPPAIIDDDVMGEPPNNIVQTNETQTVKTSTSFVIIDDSSIEESPIATVQTNKTEELTKTVESSIPSVIIDDSIIEETPRNIVPKIDNDIEIIESHTTQTNLTDTTKTGDKKVDNNDDDDDCVFVETRPNTIRAVPNEPDVIDLEYSFFNKIEPYFNYTEHIESDIIDVDAIIALNQSVLNKYKTPNSLNSRYSDSLVIDVVNTTIEEHPSNEKTQNQNENQPIINTAANDSVSSESQPQTSYVSINSGKPIDFTTQIEVVPSTSRQLPTNRNHTREGHGRTYTRRILSREVANFFTRSHQNQVNNHIQRNESQRHDNLLFNIHIRSIDVPKGTTPYPQTTTSCPSTQATTSSQRTQLATSNSQSTPNTSIQRTPNTFSNDIPPTPPKSSEKGSLGDCPICMDRLSSKQIASTICGHIFCFSCIETAIKTNKRCPSCRKILKNNGFHKIFL